MRAIAGDELVHHVADHGRFLLKVDVHAVLREAHERRLTHACADHRVDAQVVRELDDATATYFVMIDVFHRLHAGDLSVFDGHEREPGRVAEVSAADARQAFAGFAGDCNFHGIAFLRRMRWGVCSARFSCR